MTPLSKLFIKEIRTSMIFLCIGLSFSVCAILGWIQIRGLQNDLQLAEHFVTETLRNALISDQPILVHRSATEFWRAFSGSQTLIRGFEIYLGDTLISQLGKAQSGEDEGVVHLNRCVGGIDDQICLRYWISPLHFVIQLTYVLLAIFLSSLFVYLLRRSVAKKNIEKLIRPLEREVTRISDLSSEFKRAQLDRLENYVKDGLNRGDEIEILEIVKLSKSYNELFQHSQSYHEMQKTAEIAISIGSIASQVAHDIRSPLSALNMIMGQLPHLKEQQRVLIRNSVQRINDIANALLENSRLRAKESDACDIGKLTTRKEAVFLNALVDIIVSEKRMQYANNANLSLLPEIDMTNPFFVLAHSVELKRILSNLINNAVEALEGGGSVTVRLEKGKNCALIKVVDNGKGMPDEVRKNLLAGVRGVSFGKDGMDSGSGLGVYHARSTIISFGGELNIHSEEGHGTEVSLSLPRTRAPSWFPEAINLESSQVVIVLDDDQSIHDIWAQRFEKQGLTEQGFQLLGFKSEREFRRLIDCGITNRKESPNYFFMIDYELSGNMTSGLDLIEEYALSDRAILVTSRHEEQDLCRRCESLGVKVLPKFMAGFIPITTSKPPSINVSSRIEKDDLLIDFLDNNRTEGVAGNLDSTIRYDLCLIDDDTQIINRPIETDSSPMRISEEKVRYDLCLIDDDQELIGAVWAAVAAGKGLKIRLFATPQEFAAEADRIDPKTPIYVDVSLGNGVSGLDVAHDVHRMGFTEINLATGYQADSMVVPPFICRVVGKDFPDVG